MSAQDRSIVLESGPGGDDALIAFDEGSSSTTTGSSLDDPVALGALFPTGGCFGTCGGSAILGSATEDAKNVVMGGCFDPDSLKLEDIAGGAISSGVSNAVDSLLAVNDETPAGEAIAKELAGKYSAEIKQFLNDEVNQLLTDPGAALSQLGDLADSDKITGFFKNKWAELFDGVKSSANVPIGMALPTGGPVVTVCGLPSTRLGDNAIMTKELDAGPFVQGNPTVLINGMPAAGMGHLAIGLTKGTQGEPELVAATVFMGTATVTDMSVYNKAKQEKAKQEKAKQEKAKTAAASAAGPAAAGKGKGGAGDIKPQAQQAGEQAADSVTQKPSASSNGEEGCLPPGVEKRKEELRQILNDPNSSPEANQAAFNELSEIDRNTAPVPCDETNPTKPETSPPPAPKDAGFPAECKSDGPLSGKCEAGITVGGMNDNGVAAGEYGGAAGELSVMHGEIGGGVKTGSVGGSLTGSAGVHAGEMEGSVFAGDKNNPVIEAGGSGKILSAEAEGDALLGDDGKRVGVALGGSAGASVASGDIKGEINIPLPYPFNDKTISIRGSLGGEVGGVGAGGEGHIYHDKETNRTHVGGAGGITAILGGSVGLDISVGDPYKNRERPDME